MTTRTPRIDNMVAHGAMMIAFAALAALFTVPVSAQETTTTTSSTTSTAEPGDNGMQTAFGVKGGANWSTLYINEAKDVNTRMGFHFGFFGRVAPTGGLGIQLEALYDQKGATFTRTYGAVDQQTTYKFDYISVPILLTVPLGEVVELHGGGYGAALIVSERKLEGDVANFTTDPGDGQFQGFDYGLCGGLGVNLQRVQLGARYNHGLNAIASNDASQFFLGDSKNASLQVYLALALGKQN